MRSELQDSEKILQQGGDDHDDDQRRCGKAQSSDDSADDTFLFSPIKVAVLIAIRPGVHWPIAI